MEKINIAEILKDCPTGMELYSPLCGTCVFVRINMGTIICKKQNTQEITFTSEGYYMLPVFENCECMIFPSKDQRDWSKFKILFNDGDIVSTTSGTWIGITEGGKNGSFIPTYCVIKSNGEFEVYFDKKERWAFNRFATEEEKQKLFNAIKANGYKWNDETKTLEKLKKEKFDISTLKPFDKVLVRLDNANQWYATWFSHIDGIHTSYGRDYVTIAGKSYTQMIPYKGNKHLLGRTDDCDEFYKTWE